MVYKACTTIHWLLRLEAITSPASATLHMVLCVKVVQPRTALGGLPSSSCVKTVQNYLGYVERPVAELYVRPPASLYALKVSRNHGRSCPAQLTARFIWNHGFPDSQAIAWMRVVPVGNAVELQQQRTQRAADIEMRKLQQTAVFTSTITPRNETGDEIGYLRLRKL
ncbi:hypothetical protein BD311DRAFT_796825 [Dichomitus squalens]|uniref:Uncharacterized protein n=1 Tax=Dichomitus squalens TaxID=114155 RepID=A0A4Q9MPG3_9APHY|nr:hypothetical protein BD311DRAFT_796825 [Dichomitus squalens]